jgi:N-acetylglucosaminyldiphosphoundecaprenol N-acetyl-beta-D-mannosaminyltransferase
MSEHKSDFMGYPLYVGSPEKLFDDISALVLDGDGAKSRARWLACINPHSYVESQRDTEFSAALKFADWLIPDGIGIPIASKILGTPLKSRITGYDVFVNVLSKLDLAKGCKVFFLGSTQETLDKINIKITRDYVNVVCCGTFSPPFADAFTEEQNRAMINAINNSEADIVWVGMTAPKQEKWIFENISQLDTKFVAAVGAVFDFYAGNVRRPKFFQVVGLEWLYRLLQNPVRLWKRTLISAPLFAFDIVVIKINSLFKTKI